MGSIDTTRPIGWDEFIGQENLKKQLLLRIESAFIRESSLEHMLIVGPPGTGKTSLAQLVADSMQESFIAWNMPVPSNVLARALRDFNGILFLDEIHRGSTKQQEELLPLLEFGVFFHNGRKIETNVTVIAATTEPHKVIAPLADRFPIKPKFREYSEFEMAMIVSNMVSKLGESISDSDAARLGTAANGSPRQARQLALAYRDVVTVGESDLSSVFAACGIHEDGLTDGHLEYMRVLKKLNGIAGIKPISNVLQLNEAAIMELEKTLLEKDMITFTERGRELLRSGYDRIRD